MNSMTIGEKLRSLRGDKSVSEVAKAANVTVSAIYMYENDERVPRDDTKELLAIFFGKTVQEIFFDK